MTKVVSSIHEDDIDDISITSKGGSASGDDDSYDDYDNSNNNSDEEEDEDDTNNVDNENDIDKDDDEDYEEIDKDGVNDEDYSSKLVFGSNIKNIKDLGSDDNLSEPDNDDGSYDTDSSSEYDDRDPINVETSMRHHIKANKGGNISNNSINGTYSSSSDSDDEDGIINSEKISESMRENILNKFHPESNIISKEELYNLCVVKRDENNVIVDVNHRTIPILTKYEKTKILGLRAKQINNGASPLVEIGDLPTNLHESTVQQLQNKHYDGYLIALEELKQKKIPVIIRRPFPNGKSEYWPLRELEVFM